MAKILVVDDNLASCEMLSDVLTQWGYDVRQAHQGKEVLPLVEEFAPDLVLLDVMLPGMNGFEICKRIKASPKTENIAVILLTVLNDVEDRTQGIRVGADLFLSKPVNYKELRRQIEFVLSNKTHIAELEESAAVCECFLRFMRCLDPVLYRHSLQVQGYAKKLATRLELSDQSIARAQIGAALHDVEKLLPEQEGDGERVLEIFAPLKMMEWLRPYLLLEKSAALEVQAVRIANEFCKLCDEGMEEERAVELLGEQYRKICPELYASFAQLISDEQFLKGLGL